MITFDNVSKIYPDSSVALEGVTFGIDPAEFVSIVGHSGAGKTTLLKLLLAEEYPTEGTVLLGDQNIHALPKRDLSDLRRRIGMIFQDFRLLPQKTAYENIAFAMEAAGRTNEDVESDVPYALELVGLAQKAWKFPYQMSGGEKQRLAIARAIVNQPDVLVADEPTGNLDPLNTYEVVQILKKINDLGTTVMLTTHNKGVIDSLGKRVITMEKGRIARDDKEGRYVL
ncbi:MAG TPA: cell division ATP-binding protein FtsE [Candidatus Paceibacterota bacterium]|nr:cell division ATP-binding protein FtsE [Candidatus Paceibacterota bacterium]